MVDAFVIRDARADDCDAVVALVGAYRAERGSIANAPVIRGAALACVDLPEHDLIVADRAGEILGYLAVHWLPFPMIQGCEGYISDLLVRADSRGQGVGSALLRAVEARAKASGGARLMLHTRLAGEAFDRGFFRTAGFEQRGDFASFVKTVEGP